MLEIMILGGTVETLIKFRQEHLDMVGVGGSNPLGRTNFNLYINKLS